MVELLIRDLPDDVVERLKQRASRNGHTLEQELREIVIAAASLSRAERLAIIDHYMAISKRPARHDATDFIREDRDNRPPPSKV